MPLRTINLNELDNQPTEVREAIAFYAAHTVLPVKFSSEDRLRHYNVLEKAGFLERLNG